MSLIALMRDAPLVGIRQRWPKVLHAVTQEGLPIKTWPHGLATSACGKRGVRLLRTDTGAAAPWPPRVSTLPDGVVRCGDCYVATGKPRPRCEAAA